VMSDAVRRDLLPRNPCDKVDWKNEAPPVTETLVIPSPEAVERLIAYLDEPWSLLVELAAFSGLRAGEIAGLQVRHLDHAARSVRVQQTVIDLDGVLSLGKPKSNAGYRTVNDLDPDLCNRLAAHVAGKRSNDFVFGSRDEDGNARPHSHRNFAKRVFQPACSTLGLSMRFHDLRHFNASLLFDEGLTPLEVAARLGHHDGAFTLRTYGHLFAREDAGLGGRIAARRAAARKTSGNVVPLRKAAGS
jgi:integrase